MVQVAGTAVPQTQDLPAYAAAQIEQVSDGEFAALLGHPIPDSSRSGLIDINDPLSRLGEARGLLARGLYKVLKKKMDTSPADGMMLYIFHLPLRAIAKTTGGMITNNMVKDLVDICNGHGFTGLCHLIGHNFSDKKKIKAYRKNLEK